MTSLYMHVNKRIILISILSSWFRHIWHVTHWCPFLFDLTAFWASLEDSLSTSTINSIKMGKPHFFSFPKVTWAVLSNQKEWNNFKSQGACTARVLYPNWSYGLSTIELPYWWEVGEERSRAPTKAPRRGEPGRNNYEATQRCLLAEPWTRRWRSSVQKLLKLPNVSVGSWTPQTHWAGISGGKMGNLHFCTLSRGDCVLYR